MTTLDKAKTHFHYKSMLDARDIELLVIESIRVNLLNQALLKLMTGMKRKIGEINQRFNGCEPFH